WPHAMYPTWPAGTFHVCHLGSSNDVIRANDRTKIVRQGDKFMRIRLSVLLIALLPLVAKAQNTLPPDIHPKTLSRLPPVTADDLDEEGRRLLAARTNFTPGPG